MDIFPYRENGIRAAQESIFWLQALHNLLVKIGRERFGALIASGGQKKASALLREAILR